MFEGMRCGSLFVLTLLDEAKLWLTRRANDPTLEEKDFINASLNLHRWERANRAIGRFELLVTSSGSDLEKQNAASISERDAVPLAKDLPFSRPARNLALTDQLNPRTNCNGARQLTNSLVAYMRQRPCSSFGSDRGRL
jgi:hypothetical protein